MALQLQMRKPLTAVLTEAAVVGVLLIGFVRLAQFLMPWIPDLSGQRQNIELYIMAGFLFHFALEVTGVNHWYATEYCKLAPKSA